MRNSLSSYHTFFSGYPIKHGVIRNHWNNAQTEQAIARGIRIGKHQDLVDSGVDPVVKIYRHCAMVPVNDQKITSIDLDKYKLSSSKDIILAQITELARNTSVDCNLNIMRNSLGEPMYKCSPYDVRGDIDFSCDMKDPLIDTDPSSVVLYYNINSPKGKELLRVINMFFKTVFSSHFIHIQRFINRNSSDLHVYDMPFIVFALGHLIDTFTEFTSKYGQVCFLNERKNVYYLIKDISNPAGDDRDMAYYTHNTYSHNTFTPYNMNKFLSSVTPVGGIFSETDISNRLKDLIGDETDITDVKMNEDDTRLYNKYKPFIMEIEGTVVITVGLYTNPPFAYIQKNGVWEKKNGDDVKWVTDYIEDRKSNLEANHNYYGFYTLKSDMTIRYNLAIKQTFINIEKKGFTSKECTIGQSVSNISSVWIDMEGIVAENVDGKLSINGQLTSTRVVSVKKQRIDVNKKNNKHHYKPNDVDSMSESKLLKLWATVMMSRVNLCTIIKGVLLLNGSYTVGGNTDTKGHLGAKGSRSKK